MSNDSLLPPSSTKAERDIEAATKRLADMPVPTRSLWDPQTCPLDLLPWLAWALGVDDWNAQWTEAQKRTAIGNAIYVHQHRGTPGAVERALELLPYDAAINEWFEQDPPSRPFTFGVDIDIPPDAETSADLFALTQNLVRRPKNLRSHLARILVTSERSVPCFVGAASVYGAYVTVMPDSSALSFDGSGTFNGTQIYSGATL